MQYKINRLLNGLRVLTVPMPQSESATLTVWVKTGSRNENKKVGGISHFLEHMVFKGSKKRPTAREISEVVDSIGGEFNAATSKDWTNFYIKTRNANLDVAFDVLSDMVLNPILKEEEIEREKGTILQEIAMYEDTPVAKIGDVFEELAFEGNSLGWDTAGTADSVKRIIKNDFLSYRKLYYYPENMLVTLSGGISGKKSLELARRYFEKNLLTHLGSELGLSRGGLFESVQDKPQVKIKTKQTDQCHFILGFMGDGRNYKNRYAQGVLATILGGGMSSRLFIEVRERRGLAYAVKTGVERYQETGYVSTYVGTDPKKISEAIKVVLDEYSKITDHRSPITDHELRKAKEYLKGHLALALEDTSAVNSFFGEQELFLDKVLTPEEIFKKVDAVSIDEIYTEAKRLFDITRCNLAIIGPFKDGSKFLKLLKS
ncbi:MAG: Peptidase M16 domain protein [Candidatus Woesebacteria bacterium GW2011_GWB1_41_10]|uniref:Peptidase M16 domain protein n=1 Tax=Candidatus Woesebacteria bacterium GW2011_GWB1_41_10 TaxID=1618577 RepID=A0A0G0UAP6_9BACT|nr:MAG: Peptidase M16 domain protein [Candidatus Woesebacteria bacterium GW2011_GWB1_41_10]